MEAATLISSKNNIPNKNELVQLKKKSLFYHYLELHHSQTLSSNVISLSMFYHYLELHHSQTDEIAPTA